jgi:hypothetical protein
MSEEHEDIVDEVDVEEAVKANRPVPRARRYRIRIDREHRVVEQPVVTGEFILSLVGKTPAEYLLSQRLRGGHVEEVAPDREVDLRGAGVERFMTLKRDPQEGFEVRRQFTLPEFDHEHLESRGVAWETLTCDGLQWLLIHKFPIPSGYNVECAMAALQIPPSYPDAQIDMVYFHPQLARVDGRAIPNLTDQPLDGKTFQRWSRHRQGETPWRVGVDDVGTHLLLVEEWLRRELRKS